MSFFSFSFSTLQSIKVVMGVEHMGFCNQFWQLDLMVSAGLRISSESEGLYNSLRHEYPITSQRSV
jgi:hypothetical protein